MKATGIVRRIDDLGRVVIPKEIRRTMRIREGDPLEIFTDREGEVIFKKYSPIGEMTAFSAEYAETLHRTCQLNVLIFDRDAVVACAGLSKKEYTDKKISSELEEIMENRTLFSATGEEIHATDSSSALVSCAMPIISEGDVSGVVASVYLPDSQNGRYADRDIECKLIKAAADFLGKQLES